MSIAIIRVTDLQNGMRTRRNFAVSDKIAAAGGYTGVAVAEFDIGRPPNAPYEEVYLYPYGGMIDTAVDGDRHDHSSTDSGGQGSLGLVSTTLS
jgi:hypothetical protein